MGADSTGALRRAIEQVEQGKPALTGAVCYCRKAIGWENFIISLW
jgi:hypothetical protein